MASSTGTSTAAKPAPPPGTHSFVVSGTRFDVSEHYKLIKPIGHGAYGVVVSANDEKNKDKVAIKKVPRAFDDLIDAKRILREIKLLRHFDHENVSVTVASRGRAIDRDGCEPRASAGSCGDGGIPALQGEGGRYLWEFSPGCMP